MIKISEDIKKLYIEDSTPIELEVRFKDNAFPTIKGSDVLSEQMTLHESICEEEQLKFGGCNSSSFELTVFNLNSGIKGYEIKPVLITNKTEIPLGVFYVETIEKYAGKDYKKLTAYDKMRYFDVDVKDWYDSLTFPISVKNFRDSLCEYAGVEQNEVTLIADSIMLTKELDSSNGINGLSLMKQICEISGVFGRMDRYGKFDYLSLESSMLLPADDLYPANDLYPSAGSGSSENSFNISTSLMYEHPLVEDFFTSNIDGVIIVDSDGAQVITENNQNPYYVQDNFVIMGQTHETITTLANALLSKISSISYRPINSSKAKGQPYVECGDFISGEVNGYGFEAYVFQRDLTGIKALRDAYICKGKEMLENDMNGVTAQLQRLNKTTEKVKTSVQVTEKGLESEVKRATDAESEISSKIDQTEKNITAEVKRATDAEGSLSSRIDISDKSITAEVKRATDAEGELSTRIEQTEQQIVLRVDSATGKIVQVSLIGDTVSGTEFKVDADNINLSASDVINLLANGNINLTGKNITITSTNFNVDKDGNMVAKNGKFEGNITSNNAIINGGNINIAGDSQDDARINLYYDKYQTVLLPMGLMGKNNGVTKTYFSTVGGMLRLSDQTGNYTNNITHAGISCPTVQAISRLYVGGTYAENSISKITCGTATCNGSGNTSVVLDGVSGGSNCAFFLTNADISISYAHIEGSQISGNTVYANLDRALNSGQIIKIAWVKFEW